MSFFNELKRRNVIKVAAAYIIVAWLLLQVSDTLVPALHLPEWFHSGVAFLLIMGFPVAMIFAWAFELTPDGLKKEKDIDRAQSITHHTGQKLNYTIIALLAIALVYFVWESRFQGGNDDPASTATKTSVNETMPDVSAETSTTPQPDSKSIAVIPFQNRSANEENAAFFSDGVHDELLTNLSKISALKVISRTSVLGYRDTTKNLRQVGEELGVANILEGGVQRAGDTVRINVQLINAATDEHLWAETYDRQLSAENIFAIQSEIARAIASALEATLSPREQELLATAPTDNLEAYDNLLLARQLFERGNWQSYRDAQSYLQKVIELDPEFVQAHVLLARTYSQLFNTGATRLDETREPWSNAIQTALALDQNNASAHAAHAIFLLHNGLDGVNDSFEQARQLEPGNADIMAMYGGYLNRAAYPDRALIMFQMARELSPVSVSVLFGLARSYHGLEDWDKALELYARIREIDPSSVAGIGPTGGVYFQMGKMDQSHFWIFKAMVADPDDPELVNWIVRAYIDMGDLDSARRWLAWIERTFDTVPMTLSSMAMLAVHEGQLDVAVRHARHALENQMPNRWGSSPIMVRTMLLQATAHNQADQALAIIRQSHPKLFEATPVVERNNVLQAVDTAHLLQLKNQDAEARKLLQAVISAYETPYKITDAWLKSGKAQALALLGERQAALAELRLRTDKSWRVFWRWETEMNPNFKSLHDDPEFKDIVDFLRSESAGHLESTRAMEAAGEIPSPPGDDS
jgi:TolB-like protein